MDFKRARSEEQRTQRRRTILGTAAAMLTEMPVAKLSLNELSRRVGLAKSNVLRYFESREAVLLELLDAELQGWIAELERSFEPIEATPQERGDRLAAILGDSLAQRPVLCDLISAQAAVLERNVSSDVALRHKYATLRAAEALARVVVRYLPELRMEGGFQLVVVAMLITAGAWPHSQPSEALLAAYATDPTVAALRVDFVDLVRQTLELAISGLLARGEVVPDRDSAPI